MPKTNRNAYLLRKYNLTEKEYNRMFAEQGGVCKITGQPPTGNSLHVDHDHAIPKTKIKAYRIRYSSPWKAETLANPKYPKLHFEDYGRTKAEAIQRVRRLLLKASVRGLLSWSANSLLAKGRDNPEVFENAAKYLRDFEEKYR